MQLKNYLDQRTVRAATLELLESPQDSRGATLPARTTRMILSRVVYYYWQASEYFKAQGAQSPNTAYKGSRSAMYYETVIKGAPTVRAMLAAREAFRANYGTYNMGDDERGVFLRIAGYALRGVPYIGNQLRAAVQRDDTPMVEADFTFPSSYQPITGSIDVLARRLEHIESNELKDHDEPVGQPIEY